MSRIAFTIGSLACGGAERNIVNLAGALADSGRTVSVITTSARDPDFFTLAPHVARIRIHGARGSGAARRLAVLVQLRAALRGSRPDAVISFTERVNVATLLAAVGLDVPVVVCERIDPRRHPASVALSALRRLLYPRAAALVVQTRAVAAWAVPIVGEACVRVIPNPVVPAPSGVVADTAVRSMLVAVGRLHRQKGFDLLIEAFARVAATRPAWKLCILGEGAERGALEAQIAACGLDGRVSLPGIVRDIGAYLQRGDAFVLSSRFEGFPNALLEAMAAGRPVVAFACDSGPAEMVRHDEDGLLVPSESIDALAAALARVMDDGTLRARLGAAAARTVRRFELPRVLPEWHRLLDEVARPG